MNIFYRLYCRSYQMVLRALLPFLPYREPIILKNNAELVEMLNQKGKRQILLVTDAKIHQLDLPMRYQPFNKVKSTLIRLFLS